MRRGSLAVNPPSIFACVSQMHYELFKSACIYSRSWRIACSPRPVVLRVEEIHSWYGEERYTETRVCFLLVLSFLPTRPPGGVS